MNPFDITKAVDYSDEELYDYWVDFPKVGFDNIIKPKLELPMFVLGSKGSGKTHILKHFSYSMQKQRASHNNLLELIKSEGYLGVYLRCSGLNGYRFNGRGQNDEVWESIFSYYMELWLSQILLEYVDEALVNIKQDNEQKLIYEILQFFKDENDLVITSLKDLIIFLKKLQKSIDFEINNIALKRSNLEEKLDILLNPGDLIFGIPEILQKYVVEFKDVKFLYVLDEYENFSELQQKYFNSLIRERKNPTCFKIGSRRYGIKTQMTLSGEDIKLGSEFEILDLDEAFRSEPVVYKEFIKEICRKRLEKNIPIEENYEFTNKIEKFDTDSYNLIKQNRLHLNKFSKNLEKIKLTPTVIKKIIKNITFDEDLLIERTNIFLVYRAIKDKKNILDYSKSLKINSLKYYRTKIDGDHKKVILKFKSELIDSLLVENNLDMTTYCGFDNLVKMSNGIPRHFLMIMKNIFKWNNYFDKNGFVDNIGTDVQLLAIKDTGLWFLEDASIKLDSDITVKTGLERLCYYIQKIRFSDLPPECSICAFYFDKKQQNAEFEKAIKYLEEYSYIIKSDYGRIEKFSKEKLNYFQINGLLSVMWKLALSVRGTLKIDSDIMDVILSDSEIKNFEKAIKDLNKYNVPFTNLNEKKSNPEEFTGKLF